MENLFPGIASMQNFHPLFVHYPIALLSVFVLVEFLGVVFKCETCLKAGSWFLYFGTLAAIAAVAAGYYAASTVPHPESVHDIMEDHEHIMVAVLIMSLVLSFWRLFARRTLSSAKTHLVYLFVAFVMFVTMSFGADYGGLMVYKYGVGGTAVKQPTGHLHGAVEAPAPVPGEAHPDMGSTQEPTHDQNGAGQAHPVTEGQ